MSYDLYYWPNIQGRGEFVRLALETTRTPYRDVCREDGIHAMTRVMEELDTPPFACPFLVDGKVTVAQVAAILQHIGPKIGLAPKSSTLRTWLNQIQLTITDLVAEVHDTHHPLGNGLYYEDQKPEAKQRAQGFLDGRVDKYLGWFETALDRNPAARTHLVGETFSYADTSLFQVVEGLSYAFPRFMRQHADQWPGVMQLHARVSKLPAVAAYLASDRRVPFNEDGIFRHYKELDA